MFQCRFERINSISDVQVISDRIVMLAVFKQRKVFRLCLKSKPFCMMQLGIAWFQFKSFIKILMSQLKFWLLTAKKNVSQIKVVIRVFRVKLYGRFKLKFSFFHLSLVIHRQSLVLVIKREIFSVFFGFVLFHQSLL